MQLEGRLPEQLAGLRVLLDAVAAAQFAQFASIRQGGPADWKALPQDALEVVFSYLSSADLLSARLACSCWKDAAGRRVAVLDLSMKALACPTGLPLLAPALHHAFPCIQTLVLSTISFAAAGNHCPIPGGCLCQRPSMTTQPRPSTRSSESSSSSAETRARASSNGRGCSLVELQAHAPHQLPAKEGLQWLIRHILPLQATLRRLVLCEYPVFVLSPMRRLQLQQRWERQRRLQPRQGESPCLKDQQESDGRQCRQHYAGPSPGQYKQSSSSALAGGAHSYSCWQGSSWLLHPVAALQHLTSLELRLVPAASSRDRSIGHLAKPQPSGCHEQPDSQAAGKRPDPLFASSGAPTGAAAGPASRGKNPAGSVAEEVDSHGGADGDESLAHDGGDGVRHLLAGQAALLGSLASLGSLPLQQLSVQLLPETQCHAMVGLGQAWGQGQQGAGEEAAGEDGEGGQAAGQVAEEEGEEEEEEEGEESDEGLATDHEGLEVDFSAQLDQQDVHSQEGAPTSTAAASQQGPGSRAMAGSSTKSTDASTSGTSGVRRVPVQYAGENGSVPAPWDTPLPSALRCLRALRSLRLSQCVVRHSELAGLCAAVPLVQRLSLLGSVQLSHRGVRALAGLSALRELELAQVRLVFRHLDADDCPENMMNHLYGSLGALTSFTSLRFELDVRDGTHYMHSAYLLGLYEDGSIEAHFAANTYGEATAATADADAEAAPAALSRTNSSSSYGAALAAERLPAALPAWPLAAQGLRHKLRILELSQVVFDSDYTIMMFACLTTLCSLKVNYRTWPLSLAQHDLSLLAPLTALRTLHLHCVDKDDSDQTLLALTSTVLSTLRRCCKRLTSLHYTGPIVLADPGCPELAGWTSLTDLSLSYVQCKEWSAGRASEDAWYNHARHPWQDPAANSSTPVSKDETANESAAMAASSTAVQRLWQECVWDWAGKALGFGAPVAPLSRLPPPLRWCWEEDAARRQQHRCAGHGQHNSSSGNNPGDSGTLLQLHLPECLPISLKSLSLSRVAISAVGLAQLGRRLPLLEQLLLEEFELTWEHLLALGSGPGMMYRHLKLLAVSSTLPACAPATAPAVATGGAVGAIDSAAGARGVRRAALRSLGRFRSLNYLLLGLPQEEKQGQGHEQRRLRQGALHGMMLGDKQSSGPAPAVAAGMDLLLLRPALRKLKGLTLQAAKDSPGWSTREVEALLLGTGLAVQQEAAMRGCSVGAFAGDAAACSCVLQPAAAGILEDLGLNSSLSDALNELGLSDDDAALPADSICSTLGLDQDFDPEDDVRCAALKIVEKAISNFDTSSCDLQNYPIVPPANVSLTGMPLPGALSDQRPLPVLYNKTEILEREGATMYWFYRVVSNVANWAPCYLPPSPPPPSTPPSAPPLPPGTSPSPSEYPSNTTEPVPAGWTLLNTTLIDEGDEGIKPLAIIMRNASALVVLIRGTETEFEWNVDFNYSMVNTTELPGMTHAGYTGLAKYIMEEGNLRGQLDEHVVDGNATTVILAGHSLGGGVVTVLSMLVHVHLQQFGLASNSTTNSTNNSTNSTNSTSRTSSSTNTRPTNGCNSTNTTGGSNSTNCTSSGNGTSNGIIVNALLFAPPSVGDAEFAKYYNQWINSRAIRYSFDPVPQVPCSPQIACDDHAQEAWPYVAVGGFINITASDMPLQPEIWAKFDEFELAKASPFLTATHTCSYACSLSKFVNATDNFCLLHTDSDAVNKGLGTYCGGNVYPQDPEYP